MFTIYYPECLGFWLQEVLQDNHSTSLLEMEVSEKRFIVHSVNLS